eukprot:4771412-Amphidinium_carterae.1
MVLPPTDVNRVLAVKESEGWSSVAISMRSILYSSSLGQKLFSDAASTVIRQDVDGVMARAQCEVKSAESITSDMLMNLKAKFYAELVDLRHLSLVPCRHEAKIAFNGLQVPIAVSCFEQHLGYAVSAAVKEVAVQHGLLPALPGELEIREIKVVKTPGKVQPFVLAENKNARDTLSKHVLVEKMKKNETIQVTMTILAKPLKIEGVVTGLAAKLLRIDPEFTMELKFMQHVCGEGGKQYIQKKWADSCLPSATNHMTVREALDASASVKKLAIHRYLGMESQGLLDTAHDLLTQISLGNTPSLGGVTDSWLAGVSARLI